MGVAESDTNKWLSTHVVVGTGLGHACEAFVGSLEGQEATGQGLISAPKSNWRICQPF